MPDAEITELKPEVSERLRALDAQQQANAELLVDIDRRIPRDEHGRPTMGLSVFDQLKARVDFLTSWLFENLFDNETQRLDFEIEWEQLLYEQFKGLESEVIRQSLLAGTGITQ